MFLKLLRARDTSSTCLVRKTTIVTGANTRIGYYTALDFAKRGAKVILACRDKNRADIARTNIVAATGNENVLVRIVDFASLASVREFAKQTNETEERLDILVNNAGVGGLEDVTSKDGLNLLMQVNHFGPFLLTHLLLDLLKKSTASRIVNVASDASHFANLDANNLNAYPKGRLPKFVNYANSKLCNILFTNELANKLKGSGVETNSLHPGTVYTEFFRNDPTIQRKMTEILAKLFFKTSEEGAQTTIYAAVSPDLNGVSGKYFENCKVAWLPGMPKLGSDEGLAKKVWEKSEKHVKLASSEQIR